MCTVHKVTYSVQVHSSHRRGPGGPGVQGGRLSHVCQRLQNVEAWKPQAWGSQVGGRVGRLSHGRRGTGAAA